LKEAANQVKESARTPVEQEEKKATIPTGLTTLNLGLADDHQHGYRPGSVVNIIGDSHSGKTILALSGLAEMARDEDYDDWRLIYDDAEAANAFSMGKLFGQALVDRIESPGDDEDFPFSETIEEFIFHILRALREGGPCVYILDSLDALTSEDEQARVDAEIKAREEGKEIKGSYKMEKAKKMSEMFRTIIKELKKTGSLLIVISQTRDNINPLSFKKKTRSGGRALEFYSSIIMWLAKSGNLTVTKNKKKRIIGAGTVVKVDKNKYTGKQRQVEFETFPDYGIDDIGGMIDWLNDEDFWPGKKKIDAKGLGLKESLAKAKLIAHIEEKGLEKRIRKIIGKRWREIEDSLRLGRKGRF